MRRCQAPSQVLKREAEVASASPLQATSGRKRIKKCYKEENDDDEEASDCQTPPRTPLSLLANCQRAPLIAPCSPFSSSLSPHEALIRSLLNKPFKVPIPGWQGSGYGRQLGVR